MGVERHQHLKQVGAESREFDSTRPFLEQRPGLLRQLTVRGKLILMMSVSSASLVLFGGLFFSALNEVKVSGPVYQAIAREMDLRSDILPPPEFIVETHLTILQMQKALQSNPAQMDHLIKSLASLQHDYEDRQTYWSQSLPAATPLEKQIREGILEQANTPARKYFQIVAEQLLPAIRSRDLNRAAEIIDKQLVPLYGEHKAAITHLAALTETSQNLREEQARHIIRARILLLGTVMLISLLFTLSVGYYASSSITGPLQSAVGAFESVAKRDLTPNLPVRNLDEVGAMATAFNVAMLAIRKGFAEVGEIAGGVSNTSGKLETAASHLSEGTQSQASALEQTSATLEELTASVIQNAANAKEARDLSGTAATAAAEGTAVMEEAIRSMDEISVASIKIGEITISIDEIAFRTNILAVNAAIEAARAGDLGSGFAVVATEVRALAQRSADSAREIKQLVHDTMAKVKHGSTQVVSSGQTLRQIAASAKNVAGVVLSISNACSEQAIAINNVTSAVTGVERVTHSNAEQSEHLFGTAKRLLSGAADLQQIVASFNIGSEQATAVSLPATATRHACTQGPRQLEVSELLEV